MIMSLQCAIVSRLLLMAVLMTANPVAQAQTKNGFDLSGALIPVDQILPGGPLRGGIPAIDADTLAQEIGSPKAVNLIVLGFAIATAEKKGENNNILFCSLAEIEAVLRGRFGKKKEMLKASLKALEAGYKV